MDFFAMATSLLFEVNNIMNSLTAGSLLALGKYIYIPVHRGLLGQSRTVHPSVSTGNPTQYTLPPGGGGGLLHRRARVLIPLPQVVLQGVQLFQFDQFGAAT